MLTLASLRPVEIEPSLYASDLARLGEEVETLLAAGCRLFHFDVGDGHFVPPVTMGPIVLQAIAPRVHAAGAAIDCHLMVDDPVHHFPQIAEAGGDSVTFHHEAVEDAVATTQAARRLGLGVGLAFTPETAVEDAAREVEGLDFVLCMAIEPGYSGQELLPATFARVRALRALLPDGLRIQVDGGVGPENAGELRDAGASLLVSGASIFGEQDRAAAYRRLVERVE